MDYEKLVIDAMCQWDALRRQKQEISLEMLKLRQFVHATINLLPDGKRLECQTQFATMAATSGGLTEAVREVLKAASRRHRLYLTAKNVRDELVNSGFSFDDYSSNPLASVHTTLRRFKESEIEKSNVDGVAAYRWIVRFPRTVSTRNESKSLTHSTPIVNVSKKKK